MERRKQNRMNRETEQLMVAPNKDHIVWSMGSVAVNRWIDEVDLGLRLGESLEESVELADTLILINVITKGE